ncbi:MAG TPA: hypothetical protein VGX96_07110 [Candidatus Elarobacter sp.]|jgi:hypothetical protein|nr:hypothetical protein [Candidatus Elarobacter sp.]
MYQSYIENLEKVQQQSLEGLKQAQAAQIAAIGSFRELIANATSKFPVAEGLRNIPTIVGQVSELNSAFAVKLIEQQNDYVNQLVNVLKSAKTEETATQA